MSPPEFTIAESSYLMILLNSFEPYLTYRTCHAGKQFIFSANNQPDCYFVRSGSVSVFRQPNDILIELFEAPTLRGIIPVHPDSQSSYTLRVIEKAQIATLHKEQFYALLTEKNLWEAFARHMQQVISRGAEIIFKIGSPSVYEAVRYQLFELMNKPLALRESITAENYIRGKTRLSRSAIMNVLSALRKGGYIVIESGYLKQIDKIPSQY